MRNLHDTLIGKQPISELYRKARKASRKAFWTEEDVDFSNRLSMLKGKEFELAYKEITGVDLSEILDGGVDG